MAKAPQGQHIRPGHKYIRRWWDAKAGRWRYEYYVPKNPREKVGHAVVLYRNKDGSINCRLLRAAISRAAQHGYKEVEAKARRLYQKHCKGEGG